MEADQEFDELYFEFGIELDDVTTEKEVMRKEKHVDEEASADEVIIYKIDEPANRYDLLCLEGLVKSLRIFTFKDPIPTYSLSDIPKSSLQRMVVKPEVMMFRTSMCRLRRLDHTLCVLCSVELPLTKRVTIVSSICMISFIRICAGGGRWLR